MTHGKRETHQSSSEQAPTPVRILKWEVYRVIRERKKEKLRCGRDVRLGFRTLPNVRLRVHNRDTNNLVVFVKAHDLDPFGATAR